VLDFPVAARGGTTSASLYAISGLGYSPQYLWLDADGRLLGTVSSWFSLIRDPYTDAVPAMVKVQDSVSAARFRTLARTLAHKPTGALVFRDANVFDAEQAKLVPHTTVVVDGNRIRSVGAVGSVVIPAGARVIDASGKTLLPGLWDMHVHVSPGDDGILHVAAGVTTARDMGNDTTNVLALKKAFNDGSLIGPRLELAGLIDAPGPYQVPTGVLASTEPEVRAAVDRYAALGFEQIKVYSSMKPELVPAIIDEAHKHGLRVSGHVPAFMTEEQVVKLGFDEVQHVNFVFLNFIDTVKDTRSMARFTAVGAEAASLDFHSARVRDFMRLLKEHRTVIDPTVGTFEDMFTGRPRKLSSSYGMIADRLPPQVRRGLYGGGLPVTPALDQRYRDSYAAMVRMVGELWRNGITIVPGTDATPGFGLHRELELWVQGGVPAPQVLKQATIGAARVMKHDDERGSITPGKLADLVLVDGDPTTNISAIRKTDIVVKDGVLFDSKELYAALGIH
jgi:imidazolonepropionase-like amidohydrolase